MKICTAAQMRALDETAINTFGIPGMVLMENAGHNCTESIVRAYGDPQAKKAVIFIGPGNNGGDGLVIARYLHNRLGRPEIFLLVPPEKLTNDAAANLARVRELKIPIHPIRSTEELEAAEPFFADAWTVVDAIFGTGLKRQVTGHFAAVIERINRFTCPGIAVDIPSGLDADTGRELGCCVTADRTVTFGLAKVGLVTAPGNRYCGVLEVVDIGIPAAAEKEVGISLELLDRQVAGFLPRRFATAHKGNYGHLLLVAGSGGKTGAALLAGLAGLRTGTGLVTLCVPHDLNPIFETALWEAMTIPLPGAAGIASINDLATIRAALTGKQALVLGPGLGTGPETAELVIKLYQEVEQPMVVDADGLNILAQEPEVLKKPAGPRILTPHPGEMARLIGLTSKEIQKDRITTAIDFARANNLILVLKGANTVIAAPDGRAAVNPTGNPGMAAGGMGDVLAGALGGFLAQGLSPWQAACLAVYIHGAAADRLAATEPMGYLAGEVADEIPATLAEFR